ncbi:hypothetical protein J3Q64DRAFT_1645114 [Phycomyces blakesleeanus]|uniref:Uncharacterized protein n=2 Tax=Phycomyces blakesleeanus TaxID=4837 RepID=A0A162TCH2_PHYB8|nr:hypothetical protein PHYBLDRAFT_79640 [Phycomyces blakesleeanus NRRL 1555(-)]OAD66023.1 hypothetical protein PHYBLDRAFT_79640 [Phycomyces blakesleeanus NRRL 1555(-)]|eukprot:XP_018284063.1 hypothetical protein PHYBLDRAFT_79640 [Phycomyces blakesleeanus NRRL 1555(-)]
MEQTSVRSPISTHRQRPDSLTDDYEYHIYDTSPGERSYIASSSFGSCPIVVMSRHQGFEWNEELFVGAYRRNAGCESHKSRGRQQREERISDEIRRNSTETNSDTVCREIERVVEIKLTDKEKDIWP